VGVQVAAQGHGVGGVLGGEVLNLVKNLGHKIK
jgi:hypothetical protein